jgi:3-polyprenyl-4-hydroxybenzoate decarboxylase
LRILKLLIGINGATGVVTAYGCFVLSEIRDVETHLVLSAGDQTIEMGDFKTGGKLWRTI